jgi:hypothetical protein
MDTRRANDVPMLAFAVAVALLVAAVPIALVVWALTS